MKEVFTEPEIEIDAREDFFVVQMNLLGDVEMTDLDGKVLPEKEMARALGRDVHADHDVPARERPEAGSAGDAAVATMPGAFWPSTTRDMLTLVQRQGYETDEHFQRYHARKIEGARRRRAAVMLHCVIFTITVFDLARWRDPAKLNGKTTRSDSYGRKTLYEAFKVAALALSPAPRRAAAAEVAPGRR